LIISYLSKCCVKTSVSLYAGDPKEICVGDSSAVLVVKSISSHAGLLRCGGTVGEEDLNGRWVGDWGGVCGGDGGGVWCGQLL